MEVWAAMDQRMRLGEVAAHARRVEALGYDGLNVPDAVHDGLLLAQAALAATDTLRVATSVLVAFPRSPMTVAHAAWDLQAFSGGRFELGLGSQVRGNIVGRYSVEWSPPIPRMREYIAALRAIFASWQDGAPLDFEGEHYRFTKMQPFFNPGPLDHGSIPIHLGGIGRAMTALAGEAADGLMCHPTNTSPRYLREVIWPSVEKGAQRKGRDPETLELMAADLIATGPDGEAVFAAREEIRDLMGFLLSTPAYWPSLQFHGWEGVGQRLNAMVKEGRWGQMGAEIADEILDEFVPSASYREIVDVLAGRVVRQTTRLTFPMPSRKEFEAEAGEVIAAIRALK
jgi:probable F420-dependent oxidoreductase